jgi:hypothetical protein
VVSHGVGEPHPEKFINLGKAGVQIKDDGFQCCDGACQSYGLTVRPITWSLLLYSTIDSLSAKYRR